MPTEGPNTLDSHSRTLLRNKTCAYCGVALGKDTSTKDHVIGRRFVPKGSLSRGWNLIVNACIRCNDQKADLEDDLSAITMQPDAYGRFATPNPDLAPEADRKLASISRRTKRSIRHSSESLAVQAAALPGLTLTAMFVAPAQPSHARAFELARMHAVAFFYWITFNRGARVGSFWPGSFYPLNAAFRADWGNAIQRAFAGTVGSWEPRVVVTSAARGYFSALMRRHPRAACWSWALEWNQNFRLVALFGEIEPAREVVATLPALDAIEVRQSPTRTTRIRVETELSADQDVLFTHGWP